MTERPRRLEGEGVTPRVGRGSAIWYGPTPSEANDDGEGAEPDAGTRTTETDPETERERYAAARAAARAELEDERERVASRIGEEEAAVFDAHVQFLEDPELEDRIRGAIDDGSSAVDAVRSGFEEPIERMAAMEGMMAERADDLRDVRDRLLRLLTGRRRRDLGALPPGTVLLARRLTPSDTARLDPDAVEGIATETGGRTSHAAIIARSLAIPAVVGVGDGLRAVRDGEPVVVDGEAGAVVVDPDEEMGAPSSRDETAVRPDPVSTADGRRIEVAANVGAPAQAAVAAERGADGIGLFRTELFFLDRSEPPGEDEQFEAYLAACEAFAGRRVVVRTLDVGADKPVPYLDVEPERNGFLGARGIRLSLSEHADLFETQLRALLRVAATDAGASLAVMFPMIATVEELEDALERVERTAEELADAGVAHAVPELGAMVETPAAALVADGLAKRASFLSVGTNDLAGYVMAARRDVERVADLHDPLHPAVLRAIDRTVRAGHEEGAWVGVCGEMAGDPELTALLIGLGVDELSASAVTVPDVKARVERTDSTEARRLAERALAAETRADVLEILEAT